MLDIKYIKEKYNGRTMGYPDFQMRNYEPDSYSYYAELGLALGFVKSEIFPIYEAKGLPMQMGIEMAAEMIAEIKAQNLCDGVHIMAIGAEKNVPVILEKAGIDINA